ncbi:NUDIX hydrolase domain containing protein [Pseudohyphozyma bogoriensis]|nr:NUDIX hydrolase domain containing protein [Pseudohyphozyma bogoriensis]
MGSHAAVVQPPSTTVKKSDATTNRKGKGKEGATRDKEPSPSASVILIAPLNTRTPDGYDYSILLLQRHSASSTFVSAHVFPGGNVDPSDSSPRWNSLFPAPAHHDDSALTADEEQQIRQTRICAVRECFEECGVLLLEDGVADDGVVVPGVGGKKWDAMPEDERKVWREKVHGNGEKFFDLFEELSAGGTKARPGLSKLQARANWITPPSVTRRYNTHFFVSVLPPSSPLLSSTNLDPSTSTTSTTPSTSLVTSDGKETVSAEWMTPATAVRRALLHTAHRAALGSAGPPTPSKTYDPEGPIILFPPQFYLLAEISSHKSLASLLSTSSASPFTRSNLAIQQRRVRPFNPEVHRVVDDSGKKRLAAVLPGDPWHSETKALLESQGVEEGKEGERRRHRTYVLPPEVNENGVRLPGLTVMGVQRRGVKKLLGDGWQDMEAGDVGVESSKAKL